MRAARLGAVAVAVAVGLLGCGDHGPDAPRPAVVQVVLRHAPRAEDVATGFAVGPGRVVTVAHVLHGRRVGARVRLRPAGFRAHARVARVLAIDQRDDLALLAAPGLRAPRAGVATSGAGTAVVLALRGGGVRALPARVRRSIVARIRTPDGRRVVRRPALELRFDVRPGDSGAPVVTAGGRVAGIVFARSERHPRTAYAVDAHALRRVQRQTAAAGRARTFAIARPTAWPSSAGALAERHAT